MDPMGNCLYTFARARSRSPSPQECWGSAISFLLELPNWLLFGGEYQGEELENTNKNGDITGIAPTISNDMFFLCLNIALLGKINDWAMNLRVHYFQTTHIFIADRLRKSTINMPVESTCFLSHSVFKSMLFKVTSYVWKIPVKTQSPNSSVPM